MLWFKLHNLWGKISRCPCFKLIGHFSKLESIVRVPFQCMSVVYEKLISMRYTYAVFACMAVNIKHLKARPWVIHWRILSYILQVCNLPKEIFFDFGTNFVGTSKQLHMLINRSENRNKRPCSLLMKLQPSNLASLEGFREATERSISKQYPRQWGVTIQHWKNCPLYCGKWKLISRPLIPISLSSLDLNYLLLVYTCKFYHNIT